MIEFHSHQHTNLDTLDLDFRGKTVVWHDCMNQDYAEAVFATCGIPDTLINTAHPESPWADRCKYFYMPGFLDHAAEQLATANTFVPETTHCFNFIINAASISRLLLIRLVKFYQLTSYQYTWSGAGRNLQFTFPESKYYTEDLKTAMKQPIRLPADFQTDYGPVDLGQTNRNNTWANNEPSVSGDWVNNWNKYIGPKMSNTAVSLIAETDKQFDTINFTEKTLFSILGLTFPIWIGGKHQAKHWTKLGFDTYNDIINHDYQYGETLMDRSVIAFESNRRLLEDLDYAKFMRERYMGRLQLNRQFMRETVSKAYYTHYRSIYKHLSVQERKYFNSQFGPGVNTL